MDCQPTGRLLEIEIAQRADLREAVAERGVVHVRYPRCRLKVPAVFDAQLECVAKFATASRVVVLDGIQNAADEGREPIGIGDPQQQLFESIAIDEQQAIAVQPRER